MFNKNKGYTLFELMLVVALMTTISIGVLIEKRNEALQLQARVLGAEIAEFARGLNSYVGYFAAIPPTVASSPNDGDVFTGVNWLKSNSCTTKTPEGNYAASSSGSLDIGFIDDCSFLSRLPKNSKVGIPGKDEATTFGSLNFRTEFHRTQWAGFTPLPGASSDNPSHAIAVLDELVDVDGERMNTVSGLAATVANGLGVSDREEGKSFKVIYCVTKGSGTNPLYTQVCSSNEGRIVIFSSNDARNDVWLRTDGSNPMNAAVKFNESITPDDQAIVNLGRLALTGGNLKLESVADTNKAINLHLGDTRVLGTDPFTGKALVSKGDKTLVIDNGNLLIDGGDVEVTGTLEAKGGITTQGVVSAGSFYDIDNDRAGNSDPVKYAVDPNGTSLVKDVTLNKITFGHSGSSAAPEVKIAGTSTLDINSNNISLDGKTSTNAVLRGNVHVGNLMIDMKSGANKSLASLLPRMKLLDTVLLTSYNYAHEYVRVSDFTAMGCPESSQRPIVTPTQLNTTATVDLSLIQIELKNLSINGTPKGKYYTVDNARKYNNKAFGQVKMGVTKTSGQYRLFIESTTGRESSRSRYGAGLLAVYCIQDIAGS